MFSIYRQVNYDQDVGSLYPPLRNCRNANAVRTGNLSNAVVVRVASLGALYYRHVICRRDWRFSVEKFFFMNVCDVMEFRCVWAFREKNKKYNTIT